MKPFLKLTAIAFFAGVVLMFVLKLVMLLTGNTAYVLLFNFDYIPLINDLRPVWLFGYVFHFLTCIISVIGLFYILKKWEMQHLVWPYVVVYSVGGGALFFLTGLSPQPPATDDVWAWCFWTLGHGVFGYVNGMCIKKWL